MKYLNSIVVLYFLVQINTAIAQTGKATAVTKQLNDSWYAKLDFKDSSDFRDATRGFIATLDSGIIRNDNGLVVANTDKFSFLKGNAPATVNPALWRHAKLNGINGLFKVTDGVYQVRGLDMANITFIRSKNGFIVVDPLTNAEAANAALHLVQKYIANLPVIAVISAHSHADHFGGIAGIVSLADIQSGKVPYIAPKGFYEEALSENVLLGNTMRRRAIYQFAFGLPSGPTGTVDQGIGKTYEHGVTNSNLWPATISIDSTGEEKIIDGVRFVFHYIPNTEAPAEMNFYLPEKKVYFSGELATHTLHNLLPARGTKVRDSKAWALDLDQAIDLYGKEVEYLVPSHTWPVFGHKESLEYLAKQRDLYLFIHNQTIHLANKGLNADEIAEAIVLPKSLAQEWYTQDFYGTVKHNAKAVYQYYLGWYDGNPANYDKLPQEEEAKRYVEWFGGEEAALQKAKASYDKGEYRWVAESLKWVIFANPSNQKAKNLQADAFEQLAYQSESAIWRNLYLVGAKELRNGVPKLGNVNAGKFLSDLSPEGLFDFLSIAIDGKEAEGRNVSARILFPESNKNILVYLQNGVLHHTQNKPQVPADLTLQIPQQKFIALLLSPQDAHAILTGEGVKFDGNPFVLKDLLGSIQPFDPNWNIVTP